MEISKQRMHQIIMAIPGLFIVVVLFLSRQVELAIILLIFDVIGTIGGVWWLQFSKKLADRAHSGAYEGKLHMRPVKIAIVAVVLVIAIGAAFVFATLIKTVIAAATYDAGCIALIPSQDWINYAECLKNGGSCVNPVAVCK
jgi:uncharacterized membrane protein